MKKLESLIKFLNIAATPLPGQEILSQQTAVARLQLAERKAKYVEQEIEEIQEELEELRKFKEAIVYAVENGLKKT